MIEFDFNVHLVSNINNELRLTFKDMKKIYKKNLNLYKSNFKNCNFMLFNTELSLEDIRDFKKLISQDFKNSTLTLLYNFKKKRDLRDLKNAGIDYIKFHSYVQKISDKYFLDIANISKKAEKEALGILIDTSYGSLDLYNYDNLKLAVAIAKEVKKIEIVLLHSGGARVLEAMLIAMSSKNIYLETSFSVPFYLGSTIEKDLGFAYSKLNKKILYGSDFPYVSFTNSHKKTDKFLKKYRLTIAKHPTQME
jgi:hypothetical protein